MKTSLLKYLKILTLKINFRLLELELFQTLLKFEISVFAFLIFFVKMEANVWLFILPGKNAFMPAPGPWVAGRVAYGLKVKELLKRGQTHHVNYR